MNQLKHRHPRRVARIAVGGLMLCLASAAPAQPASDPGILHVEVRPQPLDQPSLCGFLGDDMVLRVRRGRQELLSEAFCSSYGRAEARIVTDAAGDHYVLLFTGEGHGPGAVTNFLTVSRFERRLSVRARLPVRERIGIDAYAVYDYRLETPSGGGIRLVGSQSVDGTPEPGDRVPEGPPPVVSIDTDRS